MKITIGNTYSLIEDVHQETLKIIDAALAVKNPGYYFNAAYRNGYWDGKTHFFDKKIGAFPTGLLDVVLYALEGEKYETLDLREPIRLTEIPDEITLTEPEADGGIITLRDYQLEAVQEALRKRRGIVNVATNGGKTEIAAGIIKYLLPTLKEGEKILFVTHSREIFHQSAERLAKRLGIEVGKIGDGEWTEQPVTLAMIPTISKYIEKPDITKLPKTMYNKEMKAIKLIRESVKKSQITPQYFLALAARFQDKDDSIYQLAADILFETAQKKTDEQLKQDYSKMRDDLAKFEEQKQEKLLRHYNRTMNLINSTRCFIGDEAHHSSSSSWYDTLMLFDHTAYRFGLTGTIDKKDEINTMRLFGCMGNVLVKISNDFLISMGYSAKPTIYLHTIEEPIIESVDYQEAYKRGIVENEYRNRTIVDKVSEKYEAGKGCLIIVSRIEHGEKLKKMLEDEGVECEFTYGGAGTENRQKFLTDMKKGKLKVLIATNILDEGVDVAGINCLWMAAAGKSFRAVLQRVGRGLRMKSDGSGLEVYDFLDYCNEYLTKHTLERYTYYKEEKFDIQKV